MPSCCSSAAKRGARPIRMTAGRCSACICAATCRARMHTYASRPCRRCTGRRGRRWIDGMDRRAACPHDNVMHVAIIDGDVSYPATSGKRLRTLNLMLQVAKNHRITYVGRCAADSEEARLAPAFLREHRIEPILVPHPVPHKSGLALYGRLFENLFSAWPYSVTSHQSEPMRRAIAELAARERVDLWQLEWTAYQPMIDQALPGPRVVIAHNVDTLIWQRYYDTDRNPIKKMFLQGQWVKFRRFEMDMFRKASRVVAVSEEDARIIREAFGQPDVDVVDNGIDRAYFEQVRGERDPTRILFLGALDWRPNLDAVGLLLDKIFPRVHTLEPSAKLVIVGRHPPASLIERARQMPGVELHADVADVRPYLGSSGVMAVPLRIGGGSRPHIHPNSTPLNSPHL